MLTGQRVCLAGAVAVVVVSGRTWGRSWTSSVKEQCVATGRQWLSRYVDWAKRGAGMDPKHLRAAFRETTLPHVRTRDPTHSHPASGGWRSSAMVFARILSGKLGLETVSFQGSKSDVDAGVSVHRDYYWTKDTMVGAASVTVGTSNLVVMVDVDYYVDMATKLLQWDCPVLLYTLQPTSAAAETDEFAFTFNKAGEICYSVTGGSRYCHKLWNYGVDILHVTNGWKTKAYVVERRQANEHHEFVFLVPIGTWLGFGALCANLLSSSTLSRLQVVDGDFAVLDVHRAGGLKRTVARLGCYNCAVIPIKRFEALESTFRNASLAPGFALVQSWVGNDTSDKEAAAVLLDYLRQGMKMKPLLVYPVSEGIRDYNFGVPNGDKEQPLMVAFMSPIYPAAFVPVRSRGNEERAIAGRVVEARADAKTLALAPNKFLIAEMERFVQLLIPEPGLGVPHEVEVVFERQPRPTQRALLDRADGADADDICRSFMKAEPYQKPSDPRIITTYPTTVKRNYSRFTYALSDYIQLKEWYSFGKTPVEIAAQVAWMAVRAANGLLAADANRMDGHVIDIVRTLERMVLLRFFHARYREQIVELHSKQFNVSAKTKLGVKYDIEFERGSGSPETALFNTVLSKFIDYLARRFGDVEPQEAYDADGQFGGDDSLSVNFAGDQGSTHLKKAGAAVGQRLDVDVFPRGVEGVNYLSRQYTRYVWTGDGSSTCDLPRALAKLHVTPHMSGVTPLEKLRQKLTGLALSDAKTPIVRHIVAAARRVGMDLAGPVDSHVFGWWTKFRETNWPNSPLEDEEDFVRRYIPKAHLQPLLAYLNNEQLTVEGLLSMPAIVEREEVPVVVKNPVIVDDRRVEPPVTAKPAESVQIPAQRIRYCHAHREGKCARGKECKYSHDIPVCQGYLRGQCRHERCQFMHVQSASTAAAPAGARPAGT